MSLILRSSRSASAFIYVVATRVLSFKVHNWSRFNWVSRCATTFPLTNCKLQSLRLNWYSSSDNMSGTEEQGLQRKRIRLDNSIIKNNDDDIDATIDSCKNGWDALWQENITPWDLGKPTPVLISELELHWNNNEDQFSVGGNSNSANGGANKEFSSLIPGCGAGYDLVTLALHHQRKITTPSTLIRIVGLDISNTSLLQHTSTVVTSGIKDSVLTNTRIHLMNGDFFRSSSDWKVVQSFGSEGDDEDKILPLKQEKMQFDFIFDYTFFCAIQPTLRKTWGEQMAALLRDKGRLLTIIFPIMPTADRMDGPPFPVTIDDYRAVLEPHGILMDETTCSSSSSSSDTCETISSPVRANPNTVPPRVGKELVCWWVKNNYDTVGLLSGNWTFHDGIHSFVLQSKYMNGIMETSNLYEYSYEHQHNVNSPDNVSRILLGSCNSQHYESTLWNTMSLRNASAMIWVGDAIYGDDFHPPSTNTDTNTTSIRKIWSKWKTGAIRPATPMILQELYDQLVSDPGYQHFTKRNKNHDTNMTVLGVWDDHDYGINNGDKRYMYRSESAMLYLQFLKRSSSATLDLSRMEQRAELGKGLYGVKVLDFYKPIGQELLTDEEAGIEPDIDIVVNPNNSQHQLSDRSVAIFLIDCRSNKSPWNTKFPEKYTLNYEADFLGEDQWQWLEASLQRSTASVNLIVQGLQVHADHYFDGNLVEDWSRFPKAQHRLYQTILSSGVSAPIIVSGDVHMAELLRRDCRRRLVSDEHNNSSNKYNYSASRMLLELTVSGMTHSWCSNTCARPQLGTICRMRWIQWALCSGMHWAHHTPAWTELVHTSSPYESYDAKQGFQYALVRNFGELNFNWDTRQVIVRVLGNTGKVLMSTAWSIDLLSGIREPQSKGFLKLTDFEQTYQRLSNHNVTQPDDWICVNHRGISSFGVKLFGVVSPVCVALSIVFLPLIIVMLTVWIIWRHMRRQRVIKLKFKKL